MKYLMAALLLLSYACNAQSRKDNAIIIHDPLLTQDIITKSLVRNGFDIESGNPDYIKTSFKGNKNNAGASRLTFLFDGDSIIARAWLKLDLSIGGVRVADPDIAEYRTMKGNLLGDTFNILTEYVKTLTKNFYFIKLAK